MTRGRWGPKWGQGRGLSFGEKQTAWSRGGRRMELDWAMGDREGDRRDGGRSLGQVQWRVGSVRLQTQVAEGARAGGSETSIDPQIA